MESEIKYFGSENQYKAHPSGKIESCMKQKGRGKWIKTDVWIELKPRICRTDRSGGFYYNVSAGIRKRQERVHAIICTLFHGPRPAKGYEIDHIDGNRSNNAASNLRWVTHKENMQFAKERGAWKRLSEEAFGFESEEQFLSIMTQINAGISDKELERRYNRNRSKFSRLRTMTRQQGFVWRHRWLSNKVCKNDYFGGTKDFPLDTGYQ
jgi:hypothetical protein